MSMLPDKEQDDALNQISIASLQRELDAANQRIAELEISNRDAGRLINELNWQLADSERAKEAAERKLAAAGKAMLHAVYLINSDLVAGIDRRKEVVSDLRKALAQIDASKDTKSSNCDEFHEALRAYNKRRRNDTECDSVAPAQIEQPQSTPAEPIK